MKDPTTGLKVYQNDITDIYLEHYKQERLSNRLVYRYNKVTQYIYDNPNSLVSGGAVGFGINALVDICYGKIFHSSGPEGSYLEVISALNI